MMIDYITEERNTTLSLFYVFKEDNKINEKYDKKGNLIYSENQRIITECKYNEDNKLIEKKTNECIIKYDKYGNEIYNKYSNGFIEEKEYNKLGQITHYKNSNNYEFYKMYNEQGKMINFKIIDKDNIIQK